MNCCKMLMKVEGDRVYSNFKVIPDHTVRYDLGQTHLLVFSFIYREIQFIACVLNEAKTIDINLFSLTFWILWGVKWW